MLGLNKLYLGLGIVAVVVLAVWFGLHEMRAAAVVTADLKATQETVQKAVETRKADLKVDVQTRTKRRATVDSVRTSGIVVEKRIEETPAPAVDPEFDRVFDLQIDAANRAIDAARGVSY